VPFADARRLIASVSASVIGPRPVPAAPADEDRPDDSPEVVAAEHAEFGRVALGDGIRRIASEIRNSLDFHLGAHGESPITHAILTGPALDLSGFDVALGRELGLTLTRGAVELASPSAAGHVPMSRLAVAAGLSVEEGAK
jgi:Tfp pilus assembly PilM family ATPase